MGKLQYHLKYSIIACLLIFFLFPLLIQNLVSHRFFGNMLGKKIVSLYDQTAESISYSVSGALQSEYDIARTMAGNGDIIELTGNLSGEDLETRRAQLRYLVLQKLEVIKYAYPFHYIVANGDGEMLSDTMILPDGKADPRGEIFYEDERTGAFWDSHFSMARFFVDESRWMTMAGNQLYCVTNILDSDRQTIGLIAINMDSSYFSKLLSRSLFSSGSTAYLLDEKGNCLVEGTGSFLSYQSLDPGLRESLAEGWTEDEHREYVIDGETYVLFRHGVKVKGVNESWVMVNLVPLKDLNREISQITGVNAILIFLCIASILFLIRFFYRKIFRPLEALNQMTVELGKGNLGIYIKEESRDEIGNLFHAFNEMSRDLKISMEQIKEQEKRKHQMELRMLQAQIKPHFVRNTLNAIRWMAKLKGAEGISRSILAFSNMLDYNFSDNRVFVKVVEEMKYLEEYLYLQQMRFQNNFSYEMQIDPEIMDYRILKLSFQPVVENAINHGVLPKKKMGLITIRGSRMEESLVFEILDDGVGIEKEKIETLLEERENWERVHQEENIALWNISKRMHMHYGDAGKIEIESEPGKGTCVRLIFPLESGKEKEQDAETVDRG